MVSLAQLHAAMLQRELTVLQPHERPAVVQAYLGLLHQLIAKSFKLNYSLKGTGTRERKRGAKDSGSAESRKVVLTKSSRRKRSSSALPSKRD